MLNSNNMSILRQRSTEDLIKCSICHSVMNQPKALPCLHTYCRQCIEQWAQKDGKPGFVSCPICREKTQLPRGGVADLKTNFFVTTLKDRKLTKVKEITMKCGSCDEPNGVVSNYCKDCKDYLCNRCKESHDVMKILKHHQVVSLNESTHIEDDQPTSCCSIHKGQKLNMFCKTCGDVICEVCTIAKHKKIGHTFIEVDSVYKMQRKDLQQLVQKCEKIAHQVDSSMADTKTAIEKLSDASDTTSKSVDFVKQQVLSEFKNQLEKASLKAKEDIRKWKCETAKRLHEIKEDLKCDKARLDNAIALAYHVSQIGSPLDIATAYPTLSDTLKQLRALTPVKVPSRISEVDFFPDKINLEVNSLGTLVAGSRGHIQEFKVEDDTLADTKGITVSPCGDVVVAEFKPGRPVRVYSEQGLFRLSLQSPTENDCPWDAVVSQQGLYYVSHCSQNVQVYDQQGKFHDRIRPNPPFNPFLKTQAPDLRGLAISCKGQILVGDVKHNFISVHKSSGQQIGGFSVSIPPYFIATSSTNKIIVSASSRAGFQILNNHGHRLRSFDTLESAILNWVTGICCTTDGNIYVGNRKGMRGIHQFTEDGNYVGCITEHVSNPWGLSLTPDEDQLVVAEETSVKFIDLR